MRRLLFWVGIFVSMCFGTLSAQDTGVPADAEFVEEVSACCTAEEIKDGLEPALIGARKPQSVRHGYMYDDATMNRLKQEAKTNPNVRQLKEEEVSFSPSPFPPGLQFKFVGIRFGQTGGFFPPDTIFAVGPSHLIEATNGLVRLSSKTNANVITANLNAFFKRAGKFVFDPKVYFDALSNRFFVVALELNIGAKVSFIHIAVSRTPTPSNLSSDWCVYKVSGRSKNSWADFPSLGMNQTWIAINVNNFDFNSFAFNKDFLKVIPKKTLVNNANSCPRIKVFSFSKDDFNINPAQHYTDDSADLFALSVLGPSNFYGFYRITGTTKPQLTNRVFIQSPTAHSIQPDADQPGSGKDLNTGDPRMLQLAYRDGVLSGVHGTGCNFSGPPNEACIRLIQVDPSQPAVTLEHDLGAGANKFLWHPSIAVNKRGDLTVAAQQSGKTTPLSAAFTGKRASGDKLEKIKFLLKGNCSLSNVDGSGRNRTGDYTGAALDPSDEITIWVAAEVSLRTSGRCEWGTSVGRTKYP